MNAQTLTNCLLVLIVLQLSVVVFSIAGVSFGDTSSLYWFVVAFGPLVVVPVLLAWHFAHPRKVRVSTYVDR